MPKVKILLKNGSYKSVNFGSTPTDADIDEVAAHLNSAILDMARSISGSSFDAGQVKLDPAGVQFAQQVGLPAKPGFGFAAMGGAAQAVASSSAAIGARQPKPVAREQLRAAKPSPWTPSGFVQAGAKQTHEGSPSALTERPKTFQQVAGTAPSQPKAKTFPQQAGMSEHQAKNYVPMFSDEALRDAMAGNTTVLGQYGEHISLHDATKSYAARHGIPYEQVAKHLNTPTTDVGGEGYNTGKLEQGIINTREAKSRETMATGGQHMFFEGVQEQAGNIVKGIAHGTNQYLTPKQERQESIILGKGVGNALKWGGIFTGNLPLALSGIAAGSASSGDEVVEDLRDILIGKISDKALSMVAKALDHPGAFEAAAAKLGLEPNQTSALAQVLRETTDSGIDSHALAAAVAKDHGGYRSTVEHVANEQPPPSPQIATHTSSEPGPNVAARRAPTPDTAGQPQPTDFVSHTNGGVDFGQMHPDVEINSGGQYPSAPIRLQHGQSGQYGFGLLHADPSRVTRMQKAGFATPEAFYEDVLSNYNRVIKQSNDRLALIKQNGKDHVAIVELQLDPSGDHYTVTTGVPDVGKNYVNNIINKGGKDLWVDTAQSSSAQGTKPALQQPTVSSPAVGSPGPAAPKITSIIRQEPPDATGGVQPVEPKTPPPVTPKADAATPPVTTEPPATSTGAKNAVTAAEREAGLQQLTDIRKDEMAREDPMPGDIEYRHSLAKPPVVHGARTKFDTPEIVQARQDVGNQASTHLIDTPERHAMREQIANDLYGNGAKNKDRQAVIVLGMPSSGKSSRLVVPEAERIGGLVIDSDMAKELLPEFNGGRYANTVHLESSDIADSILAKALDHGDNVVYPLVGRTPTRIAELRDLLKAEGYDVHLRYMHISPEEAAARAVKRFQDTGRFVDPDYVLNHVGTNPERTYGILKNEGGLKSYEAYTNEVPFGQPPRLIERYPDLQESGPGRRPPGGAPPRDAPQTKGGAGSGSATEDTVGAKTGDPGAAAPPNKSAPPNMTRIDTPKRADVAELRENLGWDPHAKTGKSWEEAVQEAASNGFITDAEHIAATVTKKPRALSDSETAGLGIKLNWRLKQRDIAEQQIADAITKSDDVAQSKAEATFHEHDTAAHQLADALDTSGTEKGRGLNAQKLVRRQDYSEFSMIRRATRSVGRGLTQQESDSVKQVAKTVQTAEVNLNKVTAARARAQAQKRFKEVSPQPRERKWVSQEDYEQAKKDFFTMDMNAGLPVKQIAAAVKTGIYHLETGVKAAAHLVERMRSDMPNVSYDDLWIAANEAIDAYGRKIKAGRGFGEDILTEGKAAIQSADIAKLRAEHDTLWQQMKKAGHTPDQGLLKELRGHVDELNGLVGATPFDHARYKAIRTEIGKVAAKLNQGRAAGKDVLRSGAHGVADPEIARLRENVDMAKMDADRHLAKLQAAENYRQLDTLEKARAYMQGAMNLPLTLKTSIDFSAPLRQGLFFSVTHPDQSTKAFPGMFKSFASEEALQRFHAQIRGSEHFPLAHKSGLYLADIDGPLLLNRNEELFGSRIAGYVPGAKQSERAYVAFLNRQRMDMFSQYADAAQAMGKPLSKEEAGAIADFVNVTTGRGAGSTAQAASHLNAVFFAPRFMVSRFQVAGGIPLFRSIPRTGLGSISTKVIAKEYAKFYGAVATTLGALHYAGVNVGLDPQSTDFGKIVAGNRRIDILGGIQQPFRILTQMFAGTVNFKGDLSTAPTVGSAERFPGYKLNPLWSGGQALGTDKDAVGNPMSKDQAVLPTFSPLTQGVENVREDGVAADLAYTAGETFGLSTHVQSHKADPLRRPHDPRTHDNWMVRELGRIGYSRPLSAPRDGEASDTSRARSKQLGDYLYENLDNYMQTSRYKKAVKAEKLKDITAQVEQLVKSFNAEYNAAERDRKGSKREAPSSLNRQPEFASERRTGSSLWVPRRR